MKGYIVKGKYCYSGKFIAVIKGDRALMFKTPKQIFRKTNSFSIEIEILRDWIQIGIKTVSVILKFSKERKQEFIISPNYWLINSLITNQYNSKKEETAYLPLTEFITHGTQKGYILNDVHDIQKQEA